jgi:hypothetical protein
VIVEPANGHATATASRTSHRRYPAVPASTGRRAGERELERVRPAGAARLGPGPRSVVAIARSGRRVVVSPRIVPRGPVAHGRSTTALDAEPAPRRARHPAGGRRVAASAARRGAACSAEVVPGRVHQVPQAAHGRSRRSGRGGGDEQPRAAGCRPRGAGASVAQRTTAATRRRRQS